MGRVTKPTRSISGAIKLQSGVIQLGKDLMKPQSHEVFFRAHLITKRRVKSAVFLKQPNIHMCLIKDSSAFPVVINSQRKAPFVCFLELVGVGYKASTDTQHSILTLKLGFSHDVILVIPPSVRVFCLRPTLICCVGTDLENVTQFAAKIKSTKPPEVYKGKGIRYRNEILSCKQGKQK